MAKANVYDMITDRIIAELEKGQIPWQKPWTGVRSGAYNRITKRPYSLLNQMLLQHRGEYATFKQWQDLGGHVRKGEKSEIVVFWKIFESKETNPDTGEKIGSTTLMSIAGIETPKTFRNSTAYIQNWLQVLRNDNKFIVSASSKAEKAVKYILAEA